jgi:hypothetical protein
MSEPFIPGLELARALYAEVVAPLLADDPGRPRYAAALLGPGSEVLGFDTERSTDHDWGPRLQIFLAPGTAPGAAAGIAARIAGRLPATFRGYPTAFPVSRERDGAARSRVEVVADLVAWLGLGFDPRRPAAVADWLAAPTQRLAELTAGAVFHDGPGGLTAARAGLAWYPRDVWRYVLACQWARIGQEEAIPGRCAEAGDELGSALVTARLARDLIRLVLLMRRRYPPYSKWLAAAFGRLPEAAAIGPDLRAAVAATGWAARERHLGRACSAVAALHNDLGLTGPLDPRTRPYFDRPYQVIGAGRFAEALRAATADPQLRARPLAGAVDQVIDSTDAIGSPEIRRAAVAAGPGRHPDSARDARDDPGVHPGWPRREPSPGQPPSDQD